ncbi:MAG: alpha/beta fold hydrolase [Sphingomonas sp.]
MSAGEGPFTFMLVHGAWHGGWCWREVATILRARGHIVHAPTLTGLCERSHLYRDDIDLSLHVADVVNEMLWHDLTDVVLCGHSYGGMVVTGVAERLAERIRSIVYLDAFLPADGQSLNDIAGAPGEATGPVPPIPLEAFGLGPEESAWATPKLTAQPPRTLSERLAVSGAVDRIARRTYLLAERGAPPFLRAAYERALAAPGWTGLRIDTGHEVMLEKPVEVAELLVAAA